MHNPSLPPVPPAHLGQPAPFSGQAVPLGANQFQQGYPQHQPVQGGYQQQSPYSHNPYSMQPYGHPGSVLPKSSGYRVSAGIVGIVLGVWLFLSFLVGVSLHQQAVLLLTLFSCFGAIAAGIVVLVKHRGRGRAAPIVLICVAGVALLFSFGSFAQFLFTFMLSTPIFIVMGIGLAREARGL
jgi:hypothetical protein